MYDILKEDRMKKKYQICGFIILFLCSVAYDFQKPEKIIETQESHSYVILEGEFLKEGKYEYDGEKTIQNIVDEVGVTQQANLSALSLNLSVVDESRLYLPSIQKKSISLNHATQEQLMTLSGIGEKTAQKIIDYRKEQPFYTIEDIMKVKGIGEKTYLRLRDLLCL